VVTIGPNELAREKFAGRSATAIVRDIPMKELSTKSAPGAQNDLSFTRQGTGTLFYTARLRYAVDAPVHDTMDNGFRIERRYARVGANDQVGEPSTSFKAGELVQVTLSFELTKERRFVAVTDPLPAGFEAVESWFDTTARTLAAGTDGQAYLAGTAVDEDASARWWRRGGFNHVERHDDRVQLFATRLAEGTHEFSYIVRATTAGSFRTAPARAEEMYQPEIFGRTATTVIEVKR
jgi:alpha-2-macroglobulin